MKRYLGEMKRVIKDKLKAMKIKGDKIKALIEVSGFTSAFFL